jgi:hypothetical protein
VKVGHRQALTAQKTPVRNDWGFLLCTNDLNINEQPKSSGQKKSPVEQSTGLFAI